MVFALIKEFITKIIRYFYCFDLKVIKKTIIY